MLPKGPPFLPRSFTCLRPSSLSEKETQAHPATVTQLVGVSPHIPKVTGSIPGQVLFGRKPTAIPVSHQCFSLSISLSSL